MPPKMPPKMPLKTINIAIKDKEYYNILNSNSIVYPDGMGAVYAARLKGIKVQERL